MKRRGINQQSINQRQQCVYNIWYNNGPVEDNDSDDALLAGSSANFESSVDLTRTQRNRRWIITNVSHHTDSKLGCPRYALIYPTRPAETYCERPSSVYWNDRGWVTHALVHCYTERVGAGEYNGSGVNNCVETTYVSTCACTEVKDRRAVGSVFCHVFYLTGNMCAIWRFNFKIPAI